MDYRKFDEWVLAQARKRPVGMNAITVSTVLPVQGGTVNPTTNLVTFTIQATADADVASGNIAHLLSFTPTFVIVTPILPMGALKAWAWTPASTDGTNVVFTGNNVVGSGNAAPQIRCWVGRLSSLIQ